MLILKVRKKVVYGGDSLVLNKEKEKGLKDD